MGEVVPFVSYHLSKLSRFSWLNDCKRFPDLVTAPRAEAPGLQGLPPQSRSPKRTTVVGGLTMRVSVLTLRLAPAAEPARHMTANVLPGDGFFARTPNVQLCRCEHLCGVYTQSIMLSSGAQAAEGEWAFTPKGKHL